MRIKEKRGEGGLRKKGILLCFMSFLLLGGCEKKENTPNPQEALQQEENQKPEVSLSENLWDFEFSIGGRCMEAACGAVQMGRKGMEY